MVLVFEIYYCISFKYIIYYYRLYKEDYKSIIKEKICIVSSIDVCGLVVIEGYMDVFFS